VNFLYAAREKKRSFKKSRGGGRPGGKYNLCHRNVVGGGYLKKNVGGLGWLRGGSWGGGFRKCHRGNVALFTKPHPPGGGGAGERDEYGSRGRSVEWGAGMMGAQGPSRQRLNEENERGTLGARTHAHALVSSSRGTLGEFGLLMGEGTQTGRIGVFLYSFLTSRRSTKK